MKKDFSNVNKLVKIFESCTEDLAREVLFETQSIYESVIEQFYNDYDPLYYNRTGSSWYGSSGSDTLFSPQNLYQQGDSWVSSIIVDPSNIPGNPYRADKDWVFERTFKKGIHGFSYKKNKGKTFLKTNGKKVFEVIRANSYQGQSSIVSQKKFFKTGNSISIKTRTMTNMSPAPQTIMNKEFKRLTGKRNLQNKFDEILMNKINSLL